MSDIREDLRRLREARGDDIPDWLTVTDDGSVECECGASGLRPLVHAEDCERQEGQR